MKMSIEQPLISVLVPVYNVEKYLHQCLSSLERQTLKDAEFICINDGSTDGSLDIIKEFVKKDSRFLLIDKQNSGYGDSMNQGLTKAHGKYIGIVESDDWVDADAFEDLCRMAEESDVEAVRANYYQHKNGHDSKIRVVPIHETNQIIDPRRHIWFFLSSPAIWASIYRRDFLEKNQIKFLPTPGASFQDTSFAFKVWAAARRVRLTTRAYLHYRIDNSSSSVNSRKKAMCVCEEYGEIERYLREAGTLKDLETTMWIGKFSTYYWNALRLDKENLQQFLEKIAPELKEAADRGVKFVEYFETSARDSIFLQVLHALLWGDIYTSKRLILKDQRICRRANRRGKKSSLHPYLAKARAINRMVTTLEEQTESLEQQIRDLRNQYLNAGKE